jgi:hypothetical protein
VYWQLLFTPLVEPGQTVPAQQAWLVTDELFGAHLSPHALQLLVEFRSPHPESNGASSTGGASMMVPVSITPESCGPPESTVVVPESCTGDVSSVIEESFPVDVSTCALSLWAELSTGARLSATAASPQFGAQACSWMLSSPAMAEHPAKERTDHARTAVRETLPDPARSLATGKQYRELCARKGAA